MSNSFTFMRILYEYKTYDCKIVNHRLEMNSLVIHSKIRLSLQLTQYK